MAYFWQIHKIWEKELFRLMSYEGKLEYVLILLVDNDSMNSLTVVCFSFFFFDWDSPHARLNSHYAAWSYKKKKKHKKDYRIQLKDVC